MTERMANGPEVATQAFIDPDADDPNPVEVTDPESENYVSTVEGLEVPSIDAGPFESDGSTEPVNAPGERSETPSVSSNGTASDDTPAQTETSDTQTLPSEDPPTSDDTERNVESLSAADESTASEYADSDHNHPSEYEVPKTDPSESAGSFHIHLPLPSEINPNLEEVPE
jgi:hypothetical protein